MYKIENPFLIKIWDGKRQSYITTFYNEQDFIRYISTFFYGEWRTDLNNNTYITNIRNSFIDKCACHQNEVSQERYIQVLDYYNRTINPRDYCDMAYKYRNMRYRFIPECVYNYEYWARDAEWRRRAKAKYGKRFQHTPPPFRNGPVPHTGKRNKYRYFCRLPRTKQIKTVFANPEMKEFNRSGIKMVPKWWDDCPRVLQRSWKVQSKARHQWQKNKTK